MRLLETTTLKLHEFVGKDPSYAILSHRWEDEEEVTFQDLSSGRASLMLGYSKIAGCCEQARSDGWKFVWIDSCCIDKSSSAELSEAINSMFQLYRDAQVCYAYLSDVSAKNLRGEGRYIFEHEFQSSKWFTRGWTLQELLAPCTVIFFDHNWIDIGTKASLDPLIRAVTGIHNIDEFHLASVAQKMSWAAKRDTSRVEDKAYCLMGLFGVNMPLLYGEGKKAFIRLQLEILSSTDDESIFAWKRPSSFLWERPKQAYLADAPRQTSGLLAHDPSYFLGSEDICRFDWVTDSSGTERELPVMTSKGLRISVPILSYSSGSDGTEQDINCLPLQCSRYGKLTPISISLTQNGEDQTSTSTNYQRYCEELLETESFASQDSDFQIKGWRAIYIPQSQRTEFRSLKHLLQTDFTGLKDHGFIVSRGISKDGSDYSKPSSSVKIVDCMEVHGYIYLGGSGSRRVMCFFFKNESTSEIFTIGVKCLRGHIGLNIVVPQKENAMKDELAGIEMLFNSDESFPDRVSVFLGSGRSVSAVSSKEPGSQVPWIKHLLKVTIRDDGVLEWPRMSSATLQ